MTVYLITGANGFLGNNIIRQLNRTEPDATIRALVHSDKRLESLASLRCAIVTGDVTKPDTLRPCFSVNPEEASESVCVIHCAGVIDISSKPNPAVAAVDVDGTRNVAQATIDLGKRLGQKPRFVYVGSVHAIPEAPHGRQMSEPVDFDPELVVGQYAKAKAEASRWVLEKMRAGELVGSIVMPSGIIGPFDFSPENMKRLVVEVARGKLRVCVDGGYDFVDVRDVAAGVIAACHEGRNAESYILSNRTVAIKEICDEVCAFVGRPPIKIVLPIALAKLGAPLCELYYEARKEIPLFTPYALHTLQSNSNFSHEKATTQLGYRTRPLQETIFDMVAWLEQQGLVQSRA